jgi:hypothetical protein
LAQGKKFWLPAAAAVTVAGAVAVHPTSPATGGVADWVMMYPVTATLSVAVNALMLTDRLAAEGGMVNAVTAGAVVSGVMVGGVVSVVPPPPLPPPQACSVPARATETIT